MRDGLEHMEEMQEESLPMVNDLIGEGIVVALDELHPFSQHPFKVKEDEDMKALVESIRVNGVLNRIIVRPREAGGFEIIAGHRRVAACKMLGLEYIPADLRVDMDDDAAVMAMIETNLKQRSKLLPSERARAYRMMRDTLLHKGIILDPDVRKNTNVQIADFYGDSPRQVTRFIRLSYLSDELLEYVDSGKLKLGVAVEIGFLNEEVQEWIADHYEVENEFPRPTQVRQMRKLLADEALSQPVFEEIMLEETIQKKKQDDFLNNLRSEHFPDLTIDDVKQKLQELVDEYLRRRRMGM